MEYWGIGIDRVVLIKIKLMNIDDINKKFEKLEIFAYFELYLDVRGMWKGTRPHNEKCEDCGRFLFISKTYSP
jgi:hypothetical protein